MASFWRIFKPKQKSSPAIQNTECPEVNDDWTGDPPNLERSRNRGDRMSVSRSGRFKQRSRRRSGLFDNPNFVDSKKGLANSSQEKESDVENDENCMRQANGNRDEEKSAAKDKEPAKKAHGRSNDTPALQTTL